MKKLYIYILVFTSFALLGCAQTSTKSVRPQDLAAWRNVPVEALDTHSIFLTMPMVRTKTKSGIEIRNYVNSKNYAQCLHSRYGSSYGDVVSCADTMQITCHNLNIVHLHNVLMVPSPVIIFFIKNGKVLDYAPTGQCYTDERAQPETRCKYL